MITFNGRSADGAILLDAFGSERRVEEPDFLKSRDFLIISHSVNISSLGLVYVPVMAAMTMEIIVLEITCYIARSIMGKNIPEVRFWNFNTASK